MGPVLAGWVLVGWVLVGRSADLERHQGETDGDDSGCPILHVDMDAFFASVEIRRRPELRGRPVVVGGGTRGVVAAASYEARRFGIRSAMAMSTAQRRCPALVVLPVDRGAYVAASRSVMAILREVTDLVEPLSIDEAFLDVRGARRRLGRPADIAQAIRRRVHDELALTCSIGVAPTKFVAKIASARCKPNGLLVVPAGGVLDFLHPLPITALWGVGPSAAQRLTRIGLRTVGDVAHTESAVLARAVGEHNAAHLGALARGIDRRSVEPHQVEKSISSENTFDQDLTDHDAVRREVLRLSVEVAARLRTRGFLARTVGLKVRFGDFHTVTRAKTLTEGVDGDSDVFDAALGLYRALALDQPRIRLLGVRADGLLSVATATRQLTFDELLTGGGAASTQASTAASPPTRSTTSPPAAIPPTMAPIANTRRTALDRAADDVRRRFGMTAVRSATLVPAPVRTADEAGERPATPVDGDRAPADTVTDPALADAGPGPSGPDRTGRASGPGAG